MTLLYSIKSTCTEFVFDKSPLKYLNIPLHPNYTRCRVSITSFSTLLLTPPRFSYNPSPLEQTSDITPRDDDKFANPEKDSHDYNKLDKEVS